MVKELFVVFFYVSLILLALPVFTFCLQILVAMFPGGQAKSTKSINANIAVLIPAHNESSGIEETLQSIKLQATSATRIIVIADNCTDSTSEVAARQGVEVIERFNDTQRGKGFALDFGQQFLKSDPPQVVIVFDADCLVYSGSIVALADAVIKHNRAFQALYLIQSKSDASIKSKLAEFAYVVKSWTRPLGFYRLGLPMQLMGSGMAFPWDQFKDCDLKHGSIVEDMKLGIDLALKHKAPMFCPEAYVTSIFPDNQTGTASQRKRWEHGHLSMILHEGIPLLLNGIKKLNISTVAMALDLIVPPIALLFLMVTLYALIALLGMAIAGDFYPWFYGFLEFFLLSFFVMLAWIKHGRSILSLGDLLSYAPVYAFGKVKLYLNFFRNRQREWVKSRDD